MVFIVIPSYFCLQCYLGCQEIKIINIYVLQPEDCKNRVNKLQPKDRKIKGPEAWSDIWKLWNQRAWYDV